MKSVVFLALLVPLVAPMAMNMRTFHFLSREVGSDEDCLSLGKSYPETLDLRLGGSIQSLQTQADLLEQLVKAGQPKYQLCLCQFEDSAESVIGIAAAECQLVQGPSANEAE